MRRIAADLTREGGFPPLLLDPFDFASLYLRRQQEMHSKAEAEIQEELRSRSSAATRRSS